ncbi:MAG TPA: UDP-N-acetylmuramate dehydrogenase [Microthrixaceae bacterium]|nr:UDP-N-acetylmuramate dehydrogenase [Microthrixaceae bacterium]
MSRPAELDAVAGDMGSALGRVVERDRPLGPLTTYRVGGPASVYVRVEDDAELAAVAGVLGRAPGVAVMVVGRGSNLLVADTGFAGVALQLGDAFAGLELPDPDATEPVARAGGAASLPAVARQCAAAGWRGFEWAVGVPGSIGGAVRMNAGGHGSDMAASMVRVRVLSLRGGEDEVVPTADLDLSYRHSRVASDQVVVWAELVLTAGDPTDAGREIDEVVRWRREHQPGGQNAGSVFTNPTGDSAGRLADEAGCRGLRFGSAEVSTKHANFIQADGGGSADDVVAVMLEVQRRVQETSGVRLVAETRLVGFEPEVIASLVGTAPGGSSE